MVGMHDGCMITAGNDYEFLVCFAVLCHANAICRKENKVTGLDGAFRVLCSFIRAATMCALLLWMNRRDHGLYALLAKINCPFLITIWFEVRLRSLGWCTECEFSLVGGNVLRGRTVASF